MSDRRNMPLPHVRVMCVTAVFMALTAISGMWSLPVGIAHIYLTDVIVCIAALLLPPSWACAAGGLGAFLGDLMFYPQAMFVTLITRTVQSLVIGLMKKGLFRKHPLLRDALAVAAGAVIMVCGYTVGHMVMYGSFETTLISYVLPQVIQAVFGAAVALSIVHVFHLEKRMQKLPV